ncbi:MAG: hypothetical protein C0596_12635 [Marinilabiliales bacterium]|nr:MAG: hypothetical protein C0596_12635 [Marinilabiliales bacterium]
MCAQEYEVSVTSQKDTIIIGEQTEIHIEAKIPKSSELILPEYKDTLSSTVEILLNADHTITEQCAFNIYEKNILVTSFDTGLNIVPYLPITIVENSDTNFYTTSEVSIFVKPYVLIDTIPVDTIYANRSGFVVFGKDGFKKEIEQYIPDSIKQSVSADSLQILKEGLKEQLTQLFSSELTQKTGLYNEEEIRKIAESSSQKMFVVDKGGVAEDFIVAGSVDTVFVQEYQQVQQGQPLFTLFKIKDIDENMYETPFDFAEFWYYFKHYLKKYWWVVVILLLLVVGLFYFLIYYKKGKKPVIFKLKPDLPAHIIALDKLEKIRKEKIWSRGQIKEFHVQITDVVREYIENRYGIYAMEMTSSEILSAFENTSYLGDADQIKLHQMLELADSVKFAKYQALQNENDLSLRNAFEFVESTKEIIEENSKEKKLEAEIEIEGEIQESEQETTDKQKD